MNGTAKLDSLEKKRVTAKRQYRCLHPFFIKGTTYDFQLPSAETV